MTRAVVDRIEADRVVLLVDGREVLLSRAAVAPDAREGDVVDLDTGAVDADATAEARKATAEARSRLPIAKPGDFDL